MHTQFDLPKPTRNIFSNITPNFYKNLHRIFLQIQHLKILQLNTNLHTYRLVSRDRPKELPINFHRKTKIIL